MMPLNQYLTRSTEPNSWHESHMHDDFVRRGFHAIAVDGGISPSATELYSTGINTESKLGSVKPILVVFILVPPNRIENWAFNWRQCRIETRQRKARHDWVA